MKEIKISMSDEEYEALTMLASFIECTPTEFIIKALKYQVTITIKAYLEIAIKENSEVNMIRARLLKRELEGWLLDENH